MIPVILQCVNILTAIFYVFTVKSKELQSEVVRDRVDCELSEETKFIDPSSVYLVNFHQSSSKFPNSIKKEEKKVQLQDKQGEGEGEQLGQGSDQQGGHT